MRRVLGVVVVAVLVLAACGKSSSDSNGSGSGGTSTPTANTGAGGGVAVLTVNTGDTEAAGTVLVNAEGLTLYHLKTESASNIQCTGSCTATWPPLLFTGPGDATGGVHVTGTLSTIARPDSGKQVTYNGLPLYTYSGDSKPGEANGQGIENAWYAVTPSTSGGGGGYDYGSSPSASGSGYGY